MKNIFLFLTCVLALLVNPVNAAAADHELVVVRIYEDYSLVDMSIIRGVENAEYLEFKNGSSKKDLTQSGQGYHKVLSKLYQEGYVLQSTFTSQLNAGSSITTLVRAKPAKP
ncbi:hypothetical protein GCM10027594_18210 [Hymenobacter agri]